MSDLSPEVIDMLDREDGWIPFLLGHVTGALADTTRSPIAYSFVEARPDERPAWVAVRVPGGKLYRITVARMEE